ncbi:hypothetical protein K491DRAFT_719683 [Lophiostoma macrostomum CBS 122681]|uniref:Mediator of RNA polymerase II transcription subunit 22 n=1 Tax=Lophiostoma macrostomum CBS 122681 TaxID=1314788 RepID=A0A6A6SWX4_9PLEO|nr:hypothetical protein K491DRAFT_719683 [Lophiostoma macrostomum CBS 122681]
MDPSKRNAEALTRRLDTTCDELMRNHAHIISHAAIKEQTDYASTAQNELAITQGSMDLIKNAQDLSTLIRNLQELWLFGALDTLTDPADEAKDKDKALEIARLIEALARKGLSGQGEGGVQNGNTHGNRNGNQDGNAAA